MGSTEISAVKDRSLSREQMVEIGRAVSALPQVEPITKHYFADGMLVRTVYRNAGTIVVGKVHKREHFFILIDGEMSVWTDEGEVRAKAPFVFVCKVGTKRVTLAHTDATAMTVHRVSTTDIEQVEAELVEDEPSSNYGPGNTLRAQALEHET
jgi:quercetin dioxygenase-like cupin family protein